MNKKKQNNRCYVYLVECLNFYKIGRAKDPKKRLSGLQVGCPYPLKILGLKPLKTLDDGIEYEAMLHIKFKEYHYNGEWFSFSNEYLVKNVVPHFDLVVDNLLDKPKNIFSLQKKDAFIRELERQGWIPVLL